MVMGCAVNGFAQRRREENRRGRKGELRAAGFSRWPEVEMLNRLRQKKNFSALSAVYFSAPFARTTFFLTAGGTR
jgi:hypothetical protein